MNTILSVFSASPAVITALAGQGILHHQNGVSTYWTDRLTRNVMVGNVLEGTVHVMTPEASDRYRAAL